MTERTLFLILLRCLVTGTSPDKEVCDHFTPDTAPALLALARHHDAAHWVGYALGLKDETLLTSQVGKPFATAQIQAMFRYEGLRYEQQRAMATLEAAHIPFVPLKGAILRDYYPHPWLRTSCDIDLLVSPDHLDRAVDALSTDGWTPEEKQGYHDRSLYSAGGVHLELHFSLRENRPQLDTVLDTVWEHCTPVEPGRYEHRMDNAYFLFHQVAHAAYHFTAGGCGVRPIVDIRLLTDRIPYDYAAFAQLCDAAGLASFWGQVQALCRIWFDEAPHSALTQQMEHFILTGGVYGTRQNKEAVERAHSGGKGWHILQRIFMPYRLLCLKYPRLERQPYLAPAYQVVRWIQLFTGNKLSTSLRELANTQNATTQEIHSTADLLRQLGL
ncbi:MAG: nucleotidyltransferase family protein [Clostridia bacterium]|nr:nucleotidyltransferase family protein [Clostridia bacterium]